MGFWSKFGKIAIPAGAIAATIATGGAASPLLGMAIGGGAGAASGALGGGGWKGAVKGGLVGGALGGIGGGALKGMGGFGAQAAKYAKYAPSALQAGRSLGGGAPTIATNSGSPLAPNLSGMQQGQGFLSPLGMSGQRRTALAGMGTRDY